MNLGIGGDVDIVIPHVDGSAPGYEALCRRWIGEWVPAHTRDLGELRYVLRSIDRHLPWVRNIILVVQDEGHVPAWLDRTRVRIVEHATFIPSDHLPTFHWATIVAHLHRIAELAERYIIWEDDVLVGRALPETQFFDAAGPRTDVYLFPIWRLLHARKNAPTYEHNLAESRALLERVRSAPAACFVYPHMPLPVSRAAWTEFYDRHIVDTVFRDTVTRKSRGDERANPTIDPSVAFANWFDFAMRRRSTLRRYRSLLSTLGAQLTGPLFGSYPIVTDESETRRNMQRLALRRPTFFNINDEAFDGESSMPPEKTLSTFHDALSRLYAEPSRFEARA